MLNLHNHFLNLLLTPEQRSLTMEKLYFACLFNVVCHKIYFTYFFIPGLFSDQVSDDLPS